MFQIERARAAALADLLAAVDHRWIGYDRHWQTLERLQHSIGRVPTYPPFNLRDAGEGKFQLELAVAGFRKEQLKVTVAENVLTIEGAQDESDNQESFVHRGIATRKFRQMFPLYEHVRVENATFTDGILRIELIREIPEEKRPRDIEIG